MPDFALARPPNATEPFDALKLAHDPRSIRPKEVGYFVRIIAATHRNLAAMIEDNAFREDLYYRLSVIPLELPPLRERIDDIPELVQHFFLKAKQKYGREQLVLPNAFVAYFCNYRWPGNIRELENIIERVVVLAKSGEIGVADLPEQLRREHPSVDTLNLEMPPQGISLEAIEKELILRALP